ncbi:MAG: efflux RND transporter periplasmic adaptor subunit [Verrucomicrobiota bacterium]
MNPAPPNFPTAAVVQSRKQRGPQGAEVRPELTLVEIERLFAEVDEDDFDRAATEFMASVVGARLALLYQRDEKGEVQAKVMVTNDQDPVTLSAQPKIDLIAAAAMSKGASQRATVTMKPGAFALLCVPFALKPNEPRAMAVLLGPDRAAFVEPSFTLLHLVTQLFVRRHLGYEAAHLRDGFNQSTLLIDLFSKTSAAADFRESVAVICNEMRELLGCSRIGIGMGDQHRCKVAGLSGAGRIENPSQATALLGASMREAIGVDAIVAWPERVDLDHVLTAAAQKPLLETLEAAEVVSLPLVRDIGDSETETIGAWSFLWTKDKPMTARHLELVEAATPHVGALVHLASQSHPRGIRGVWRRFWARASKAKKAAWIFVPALLIGAMFVPVEYQVSANCRLQPEQVRQIAAPFNGRLDRAFVKTGDTVESGQLLAELDGKEIGWKLSETIARQEGVRKKRDQARSVQDISAQQLAQFELDALSLEVKLMEYQKENLQVLAPIGGVIVSGNLERSSGVPVTIGQKLFDIASLDQLELEIQVPDSEISLVKPGQDVWLRLEANANFRQKSTIEAVYPISEIHDDRNVFICLARFDNADGEMRPGMRGKARIMTENKPLGWILFHRLWDWIRLRVW